MKKILIIGQGLAGSVLAHRLFFEYGIQDITIVDAQEKNATQVSSGIMNPVTGRRIVKTWQCELLFPIAKAFYEQAEQRFQEKFIEEKEIIRFFESTKEYNDFTIKTAEQAYQKYIIEEQNPAEAQFIKNDFGAGKIAGAYVVNASKFLEATKVFFHKKQKFIKQQFSFQDFQVTEEKVIWNGKKYDLAIFCEGYHALQNPYFNSLPFRPAKGEVFIASIPNLPQERLIKKGVFFMPLGEHKFWVGATYVNHDLSLEPSEKGLTILKEKINKALQLHSAAKELKFSADFKIEQIEVGIRPATKDRRPMIGKHKTHDNLMIFNGFGTKGISLSPWAASQLCEFIIHKKPIHPEINVERFWD